MKNKLIEEIVRIAHKANEGHIGSSLSILDILFVLYNDILNIDSIRNNNLDRDRFILSKGHASLGLFVILAKFNLLEEDVFNFCEFDSSLGGHPCDKLKFVESSTGSLGHGLPIAVGIALSNKIQNFNSSVYTLIGDGEANEGTIWESALLASHHKLNNLFCIMDHNHSGDRALNIDSIIDKFNSFGWNCLEVDGHNHIELIKSLSGKYDKPTFILANTTKGKGIDFMENNPEWHHKAPTDEQLKEIIDKL